MVQRGQALVVDGHEIPPNWQIGGFELEIGEITEGRVDEKAGILRGAAGKAWLRLPCARPPIYTGVPEKEGPSRLSHAVEVVDRVLHPQTEIGIAEARRLRPGVAVGETIALDLAVDHADLQEIVQLGRGVGDWLDSDPRTVGFPLAFGGLTVSLEDAKQALGRVTLGSVTWPAAGSFRGPIEIDIDGFTLIVSSLQLSPTRSTGVAKARLPGGLTDVDSCQPATLDLGRIAMSPVCDFYVDAPAKPYGPWLLADTGMVIEGTGYVLDLSAATSPPPWPPAWRGLTLAAGTATGEKYVNDPCNTGYLRGHYTYTDAIVISPGFFGSIFLAEPVTFGAINPLGQTLTFDDGAMDVWYSQIVRGELKNRATRLPVGAVCDGRPGLQVATPISAVSIQPDLDLAGVVDHGDREISWGELTHIGNEVVAWTGRFGPGYLYLPAGPDASFSPVSMGTFSGPAIDTIPDTSLAELEAHQAAGVSFPQLSSALVFSPDRPGGRANPIKLQRLQGWIRVGITGVDGALSTFTQTPADLGDPKSIGYAGNIPFNAKLFLNDKRNLLAELATSASFDSNVFGQFDIPLPCEIRG